MSDQVIGRRGFITGLVSSLVAAPAIVRVGSIMPVKAMRPILLRELDLFGRSPMLDALPDMVNLDAMMLELIRAMAIPRHFLQPPALKLLTLRDNR